jgi:hypothetical protein
MAEDGNPFKGPAGAGVRGQANVQLGAELPNGNAVLHIPSQRLLVWGVMYVTLMPALRMLHRITSARLVGMIEEQRRLSA